MRRAPLFLLVLFVTSACAGLTLDTPRQKYFAAEAAYREIAATTIRAVDSGLITPGSQTARVIGETLTTARASLDAAWAAIREGNDDLALSLIDAALVAINNVQRRVST